MQKKSARRPPSPSKSPRGFRAPDHYRTEQLIEEVRKNRVLWCRAARGFYSTSARLAAYNRVADAMNRQFPDLRPWHGVEVQHHFRLLSQYQYACLTEHGPSGKPHCFTCRSDQMSFMNAELLPLTDWTKFIARL
ncbi:hypothetical protein AAVH_31026 [Aphelenchoides avenae]|nr:hypothetical protein AAVH_31026 [Aphelenchus avenae]